MEQRSVSMGTALSGALIATHAAFAQSTSRYDADEAARVGWPDAVAISGDGRWLFLDNFVSMLPADTDAAGDVYAIDRLTRAIELISVATSGVKGNAQTSLVSASPTGRHVLVFSHATNYSSLATGEREAYVRDRQAGTMRLASCNGAGFPSDGFVWTEAMSDDARFVVFETEGTNFGVVDSNDESDVYVRDMLANTTTLISAAPGGAAGNNWSGAPAISGDGRWIAFVTLASDLFPNDTNAGPDLVICDRTSGALTPLTGVGGAQLDNGIAGASWSFDGSWLAFATNASNAVAGDTGGVNDVFVLERATGTIRELTIGTGGVPANDDSYFPSISRGAERVAFHSRASNLVPGDDNGGYDAFVADIASGAITRLSVSSTGDDGVAADPFQGARTPSMSDDGRFAAFTSSIVGLVIGQDVDVGTGALLRDALSPCAPVVDYCTAKPNSGGWIPRIQCAGDPYATGPDTFCICAADVMPNRSGMLVWSLVAAATPFAGGTLCLAPPFVRTRAQDSGHVSGVNGSGGRYGFYFSHAYQQSHGLGAGSTVCGQYWSRDPGFAWPNNLGLTNAIRFTLGP